PASKQVTTPASRRPPRDRGSIFHSVRYGPAAARLPARAAPLRENGIFRLRVGVEPRPATRTEDGRTYGRGRHASPARPAGGGPTPAGSPRPRTRPPRPYPGRPFAMWSATRHALAMMVRVGLAPVAVGNGAPSTTNRLSTSCAR